MAGKILATPEGELRWTFITGDGRDQSKNNDGSKMQKMSSLVLHKDSKECKELQAVIDQKWKEYKAANPKKIKAATEPGSLGYKLIKDPETDAKTDFMIFAFKTNSFFPKDNKPNNIPVYSGKGKKLIPGSKYIINGINYDPADTFIGNGSTGVIHYETGEYEFQGAYGISLYLKAVQIGTLVEGSADITVSDISKGTDNVEEVGEAGEMPAILESQTPNLD